MNKKQAFHSHRLNMMLNKTTQPVSFIIYFIFPYLLTPIYLGFILLMYFFILIYF